MTGEHVPTTALPEDSIGMLNQLTGEMPPDGGIPPILVTEGPRGVNVMHFVMPGTDQYNEDMAYAITANIAVLRGTEVVFVAGAWLTNPSDGTGEIPSSTEVVVILHGTAEGERMMFADVIKGEGQPVIGRWANQTVDAAQSLGIFGEAIRYGTGTRHRPGQAGTARSPSTGRRDPRHRRNQGRDAGWLQIWRQSRR